MHAAECFVYWSGQFYLRLNLLVSNLDSTLTTLGRVDLSSMFLNGMVTWYNYFRQKTNTRNNHAKNNININEVLGEQGHKHPHDAILLSNGDVVIATWNHWRIYCWKKEKPSQLRWHSALVLQVLLLLMRN